MNHPELPRLAAFLTEHLEGPKDPAALVWQDSDDHCFPGVPAPGSESMPNPLALLHTPDCSRVVGCMSSA